MNTRSVLRHASIILLLALLMAIPIGPLGKDPRARLFAASHVTGLLVFFLMTAVAFIAPRLRLGKTGFRLLWWCTVPANYVAVVILGLFSSLVKFPSLVAPELGPVGQVETAIIIAAIVVISLGGLVLCGLLIYGLRGDTDPAASAP